MIFTEQEVADRFKLHQFIYQLFTPCKKKQSDFVHGIDAQTLYELFCMQYPENVLSSAIVNNMLLTGGFVEKESEEVNCMHAIINREKYEVLNKKAKLMILGLVRDKVAITLRQLTLGKVTTQGIKQMQVDSRVLLFFKIFTINNTNRYFYQFGSKARSTMSDVYEYYTLVCNCYRLPVLPRKQWCDALETLGVRKTKGCVDSCAGQIYFTNMFVPKNKEDLMLTLDWGMCCLSNGHTHVTSLEDLLENIPVSSKDRVFQQNLERMCIDESSRTAIQKEKEETFCWRADQAKALFICSRAEKNAAKNNMGHNGGSKSESTPTQISSAEVKLQSENSRTSSFNNSQETQLAAATNPVESVNAEDRNESARIATVESTNDPLSEFTDSADKPGSEITDGNIEYGQDDEGSGEDAVDSTEEPSLGEIAKALSVPYKMSPNNFTKEVMADWCTKMAVNINVDDYYDILIDLITKL